MSSSATPTFPGMQLQFAPGVDAKTAPAGGDWVDLTARLRSFTIERGRKTDSEPFAAGTMTVALDNLDRVLDPEYAAGTYFGQLVPNVWFRLVNTFSATTATVFQGHNESWPQSWPGQDADAVVNLTIVDPFGSILAGSKLPGSYYEYVIRTDGPSAWFRMSETLGTIAGDSSGNGNHGTYNAPIVNAQSPLVPYSGQKDGSLEFDGIDDFVTAPESVVDTSDTTCSVEFWMKSDQVPSGGGALLVKIYAPTKTLDTFYVKMVSDGTLRTSESFGGQLASSSVVVNDNKVHHIVLSSSAGAGTVYVDGVDVTIAALGDAFVFQDTGCYIGSEPQAVAGDVVDEPFHGFIDEVSFWDTALSSSDVAAHYQAGVAPLDGQSSGDRVGTILDIIGWDATLRDLDEGASFLGPAVFSGTALDHLQLVEQTEMGWLFSTCDAKVRLVGRGNKISEAIYNTSQATFGDQAGEQKYADITLEPGHIRDVVNTAAVSRQGGSEQTYTDATSASQYGDKDKTLSGLLMRTETEAYERGFAEVQLRKDPQSRVSQLVIMPGRDGTNLYPKVLTYDLGTRLRTRRRPQGTTVISKDVHIAGIRHEATASNQHWVTTWSTTAPDPNQDIWFVFDSASQGKFDTNEFSY